MPRSFLASGADSIHLVLEDHREDAGFVIMKCDIPQRCRPSPELH
jgi:hypothetical protein